MEADFSIPSGKLPKVGKRKQGRKISGNFNAPGVFFPGKKIMKKIEMYIILNFQLNLKIFY